MRKMKMTANRYQEDQPTRLALLEKSVSDISKSLVRLENKIDAGFKDNNERFVRLETKVDNNFKWVISSILLTFGGAIFLGILTTIGKIMHWIT